MHAFADGIIKDANDNPNTHCCYYQLQLTNKANKITEKHLTNI